MEVDQKYVSGGAPGNAGVSQSGADLSAVCTIYMAH